MPSGSNAILALESVHKRFGTLEVLRGIDLSVASGEVLAIIGPSGGGKSTILRCVNLLETISGGRILFDGQEITAPGVDHNTVRTHIGMVFQQFNLFPHLRVLPNLILAPKSILKTHHDEAVARARILLKRVGLEEKAHAWPTQLSGGQQQRVAIARALMMQPRLMLFDEVTSALDPALSWEVLSVMRDLAKSGMTMVVVTHEMQFARDVADRIAFVDNGQIVEVGPPNQILNSPGTERLRQFLQRSYKDEVKTT